MTTLTTFFIGIAVALIVLLCLVYFMNNGSRFSTTLIFVYGFIIGMLTLYIKMRLLGL